MKTVINTRIDVQLKKQLQELADGMGLSLSSLVSVALTKVAREQRIELSYNPSEDFGFIEYDELSDTNRKLYDEVDSIPSSQLSNLS